MQQKPSITLKASGWPAVLLLAAVLAGLFAVPRLLSHPPSTEEASQAVRESWSRDVRETWLPRLQRASGDSAAIVAERMAAELEFVLNREITRLEIRRSLLGPPFGRRWTWFLRVHAAPAGVSYYRMSRGLVTGVSPFWWRFPLL